MQISSSTSPLCCLVLLYAQCTSEYTYIHRLYLQKKLCATLLYSFILANIPYRHTILTCTLHPLCA